MTRPKQPPSSNTHETATTAISIHRQLHTQSHFLVTPTTTATMTTAFSLQTLPTYQENVQNHHDGPATMISFQLDPFTGSEKSKLKLVESIIVRVFICIYDLNLVGGHNGERWILVGTVERLDKEGLIGKSTLKRRDYIVKCQTTSQMKKAMIFYLFTDLIL